MTPASEAAGRALTMIHREVDRAMPEATYRLAPLRYRCRSEVEAQFDAVEAFLPWPLEPATGDEDYELTMVVDAALLASVRTALGHHPAGELIETFAGETWRRCFRSPRGCVFLEAEGGDQSYCVSRQGNRIAVVTEHPGATTHLVRCLREVHLRTIENAFGLSMHAAAVARAGRGFLIAGSKGAGKTSLALSLCLGSGFDYLANDRTMVLSAGPGFRMLPFPLACRVGFGTALQLAPLRRLLCASASLRRPQPAVLARLASPDELRPGERHPDEKLELAPNELVRHLGLVHGTTASLAAVVVPVLEPARTTVSLEMLPPAMGLQILERECQTPREEKWIAPWLLDRYPEAELTRARQVMLSRLAGSIPMAALRVGFDYDDPGVQAAILSSLSVLVDGGDQAPSMKARRSSSRKRSPSHSSA